MKVYKSKIGIGLVVFLALTLGFGFYTSIKEEEWPSLFILMLIILFFTYIFLSIKYIIDGEFLRVRCGFLVNKSYPIKSVTMISETNNPISAPAASLDRLLILFDSGASVIISPKQKAEFIQELKKLNPNIVVRTKA